MKFTFGIITTVATEHNIATIIETIQREEIPEYEIIIVGGSQNYNDNFIRTIEFNENTKPSWITRKKNIITKNAKFENIVFLHDYISLSPGWYRGFLDFGNDFDICTTPILNNDNTRYADWVILIEPGDEDAHCPHRLLPYNITTLTKCMYIPGLYWVAKKDVMEKFPLDENLSWGQGEDGVWSKQVRQVYNFSINTNSSVKFLKYKIMRTLDILPEKLNKLQNL